MNKVELVSEGHGKKKYIHKNESIFSCLILRNIINRRILLESAKKCNENRKYERRNILRSVCTYAKRNNIRRLESWMIRD